MLSDGRAVEYCSEKLSDLMKVRVSVLLRMMTYFAESKPES